MPLLVDNDVVGFDVTVNEATHVQALVAGDGNEHIAFGGRSWLARPSKGSAEHGTLQVLALVVENVVEGVVSEDVLFKNLITVLLVDVPSGPC